jgi:hypothetical protein
VLIATVLDALDFSLVYWIHVLADCILQLTAGLTGQVCLHSLRPTAPPHAALPHQDMGSLESYLAVSKRICLYLARTHPQFTIDQLHTEICKQVQN